MWFCESSLTFEACSRAVAREGVDAVDADASVLAGSSETLVEVLLALGSVPTRSTATVGAGPFVEAGSSVETDECLAVVNDLPARLPTVACEGEESEKRGD